MNHLLLATLKTAAILAVTVVSFGDAHAEGSADKGKAVFKSECRLCHSVEPGDHKVGPALAGIFGMTAGATAYTKYLGLKGSGLVWDEDTLDGFLENPKKFLGRSTTMPTKLSSAKKRANVIAYLKTLK